MGMDWGNEGEVNDQIQASIDGEIARIRSRLPQGKSLKYCEECGNEIPIKRRKALPGVRLCINCQEEQDKQFKQSSLFNRRGSIDSQLR